MLTFPIVTTKLLHKQDARNMPELQAWQVTCKVSWSLVRLLWPHNHNVKLLKPWRRSQQTLCWQGVNHFHKYVNDLVKTIYKHTNQQILIFTNKYRTTSATSTDAKSTLYLEYIQHITSYRCLVGWVCIYSTGSKLECSCHFADDCIYNQLWYFSQNDI